MEVLTISKTDIRDTERTINKAISKVKKNNFGDKVASRLILFIMAVIYLFLTYGILWSTATPENQIFLEKAEFLKNLCVKIIVGLEYENEFIYALFGCTLVVLIAAVILFPLIKKFFKLFYIEKKTKNETPHYNEDWKNLIELRYKLGNTFREYDIVNDVISAIGLYFFSSVILTSVYYFNCFSFGKAVSSVLIASVIGTFCYGIAVALFVLAEALFYDGNEKLLYIIDEFDDIWFQYVRKAWIHIYAHLLAKNPPIMDYEEIKKEVDTSKDNFEKLFEDALSEKIDEMLKSVATYEEMYVLLDYFGIRMHILKKEKNDQFNQNLIRLYRRKKDTLFYMFYDALKENKSYKKTLEVSIRELKEFLELKSKEAIEYVIDEEEYQNAMNLYLELTDIYEKSK